MPVKKWDELGLCVERARKRTASRSQTAEVFCFFIKKNLVFFFLRFASVDHTFTNLSHTKKSFAVSLGWNPNPDKKRTGKTKPRRFFDENKGSLCTFASCFSFSTSKFALFIAPVTCLFLFLLCNLLSPFFLCFIHPICLPISSDFWIFASSSYLLISPIRVFVALAEVREDDYLNHEQIGHVQWRMVGQMEQAGDQNDATTTRLWTCN